MLVIHALDGSIHVLGFFTTANLILQKNLETNTIIIMRVFCMSRPLYLCAPYAKLESYVNNYLLPWALKSFQNESTLKRKNLLLEEQILSVNS